MQCTEGEVAGQEDREIEGADRLYLPEECVGFTFY